MRGVRLGCLVAFGIFSQVGEVHAQTTTINGNALPLISAAISGGTSEVLNQNGYVGTYINLSQPGPVTFTVNASGTTSNSVFPDMTLSIADYNQSFSVNSGSLANYSYTTPTLPAGTYLVRTQLDNSLSGSTTLPSLTVGSLNVTGATVVNSPSDSTALDAANTYINNFRQGTATVSAPGLAIPGTSVNVTMLRNAFNFGSNVPGTGSTIPNTYLTSNPAPGSTAANFQQFVNTYFNTLVPSNAGKWDSEEATQNQLVSSGVSTMIGADAVTAYAKQHNMTARMHNLIWGSQQPSYVQTDLSSDNVSALNAAVTNRIGYYVGGGDTHVTNPAYPSNQKNTLTGDVRAVDYSQLDVLNEPVNNPPYLNDLGTSGIANIYNQVKTAVANAGANVTLYSNEYNVLQNSMGGSDPYANWYRQYIEQVNSAGFGKVLNGVGVEFYPTGGAPSNLTVAKALTNLSVTGSPITISEFGEQNTETGNAVTVMDNAIRMAYGTPNVNTFMYWGWWAGATSTMDQNSVMVNTTWKNADGSWNLTAVGQDYVNMMTSSAFQTAPQDVTVAEDGSINFHGVYGEYALSYNGNTYATVDFEKGAAPVLWVKGDFNLDGKLTNADIQALLSALTNVNSYQVSMGMSNEEFLAICDINGDGQVNKSDVTALMNLLVGAPASTGPAITGVPEPSSIVLVGIGALIFACGWRTTRR